MQAKNFTEDRLSVKMAKSFKRRDSSPLEEHKGIPVVDDV